MHNAGKAGKKYLPETLGSGAAFFDADGDGWIDILLVNGKDWTPRGRHTTAALYRNNHNGTFTDITQGSGLDVEMYGIGVAVADYDNDGRDDVYITALEGDHLFHNEGNGKFKDVTDGVRNQERQLRHQRRVARLRSRRQSWICLSPTMFNGPQKGDLWCSLDGSVKSYCTPESYKGTSSKLFHNLGGGRFEDVTNKAGLGDPTSKSLGVTVIDFDSDGWPDLFVSNDTQPNKLYHNNKNGTFSEQGHVGRSGFRRRRRGARRHGRRLGRLRPHGPAAICWSATSPTRCWGFITTKATACLWMKLPVSSVGRDSLLSLTFGVFFFDYDLDGYPDILTANGHIEEEIGRVQPKIKYQEPPLLFRNLGSKKFENVSNAVGADFTKPLVARGAIYGDFDHDGDLDVLSLPTTAPRTFTAMMAETRTSGSRSAPSGRNPTEMASALPSQSLPHPANNGTWCAAVPATLHKAILRWYSVWARIQWLLRSK